MEGTPELVPVRPAHRFDEARLADYLRAQGLLHGALRVQQFQGGQSNPTYLLDCDGRRYVLRKKPPGHVLPSAHQVDREYRVMKALREHSRVPVPTMHVLCQDPEVIGTIFFVMDYVPGRVFSQPSLEAVPRSARAPIYHAMIDTLAALHQVDYREAGLDGFGRPNGYLSRQVKRWSAQYEASKTDDLPAMDNLIAWLREHIPADDEASIAHGDFRLGNLLIADDAPQVVAVLDWELTTIGHPLADLAYCCMPYHMPHDVTGMRGLAGLDLTGLGIPDEHELLHRYCERTGRDGIRDWPVYLAFSMFRSAAILQGVFARALQGNASSSDAREVGHNAGRVAEIGWRIASTHRQEGCEP